MKPMYILNINSTSIPSFLSDINKINSNSEALEKDSLYYNFGLQTYNLQGIGDRATLSQITETANAILESSYALSIKDLGNLNEFISRARESKQRKWRKLGLLALICCFF